MQYEQKPMTQTQENGQEKGFYTYWPESIREIRQKTFILAIFVGPVIKHNRNELQCGKSAKTDDFISRNRPKTGCAEPWTPLLDPPSGPPCSHSPPATDTHTHRIDRQNDSHSRSQLRWSLLTLAWSSTRSQMNTQLHDVTKSHHIIS